MRQRGLPAQVVGKREYIVVMAAGAILCCSRGPGYAGLIENTMAEQGMVATQVPQQLSPAQIEARYQRGMKIARECQALPRLDARTPDEIIGYDDFGLPT